LVFELTSRLRNRQNKKAVKLMINTSAALSFGELLAYGEWELLSVFARYVVVNIVGVLPLLSSSLVRLMSHNCKLQLFRSR